MKSKMQYTPKQLEALEGLRSREGFKVLLLTRDSIKEQTLAANSRAKNRDIISKDVVVHESAIEQIRENNGFLAGFNEVIDLVETARKKRLKDKA